jgi:site-specific recombinase XerD
LQKELDFLAETHNFQYLFRKKVPPHPKSLLRMVNEDLANTSKVCRISDNITYHSFRISVISKLLLVTDVHTVAYIIGYQDIRSTMKYNRYRLSKSSIQDIYVQAERRTDFVKQSDFQ